jgi:chromate transporter
MRELLRLFFAFAKVGLFTFGGGYAMLPMLEREIVNKNGWATQEELLNYFAIGQCTPGVIAVNTATFVGFKQRGVLGGIFATLGIIAPSLVIIVIIALVLANFAEVPEVKSAFAGIRVAVSALIVAAVIRLIKSNVRSILAIVLCVAAFVVVAVFGASPVYVVIGAAVTGLLAGKWGKRK